MEESTYLVDQEHPAELARLTDQDLFMLGVTGLFPSTLAETRIANMQRVLDIGCGPGNWCLHMGIQYPHLDVLGIDISVQMIAYAQGIAESREAPNVHFQQLNALKPFPFESESFDYINIRFSATWISSAAYPVVLRECRRILLPGGLLCITESENGLTTDASPAVAQCFRWLAQAMSLKGLAYGNGQTMSITPMLLKLLKDAGFTQIRSTAYVADASAGQPSHPSMNRNLVVLMQLIRPLILQLGVSPEDFQEVLEKMQIEI